MDASPRFGPKVLITQIWLQNWGGTEALVRDLSLGLVRRGWRPVVYSPELGPPAEALRQRGIPVVDDIRKVGEAPDVIHGQHAIQTAEAIIRFPHAPAINVCHGWAYWGEAPVHFPQVQFHVGVSEAIRERILCSPGVSADRVLMMPNGVDLGRVPPRGSPLGGTPRRAAVFHKSKRHLDVLSAACEARGISLKRIGAKGELPHPELELADFDLVFATGRSAIEALCAGCAVILCDPEGMGGLVTLSNFQHFRRHNFALRALAMPMRLEALLAEIDRFDAVEAGQTSALARREACFERCLDRYLDLYGQAIERAQAEPWPDTDYRDALGAFLHEYLPRKPNHPRWSFPGEREALLARIAELEGASDAQAAAPRPAAAPAHARISPGLAKLWRKGLARLPRSLAGLKLF